LVVLQKKPIVARATWRTKPTIPDRWPEKVDRKLHPHIKPIGLISALIEAITSPGDLIVDPAAGSFVVMHAAHHLGREFVGCDIAYQARIDPVRDDANFDRMQSRLALAPLALTGPGSLGAANP
jgi:hypothetical protein